MKHDLFRPFNLEKWLVVGFTAFLAALGSGGNNFSFQIPSGQSFDLEGMKELPGLFWRWLLDHPIWLLIGSSALVCLLVFWIVFLWLSSRGKFMFLDNVIHNRAQVVAPWVQFKQLGNSLFWWRLGFSLIALLTVSILVTVFVWSMYTEGGGAGFDFFTPEIVGFVLLMLLIGFIFAIIAVVLDDFVVPIMVKTQIPCTSAWRIFFGLFVLHKIGFFAYGLLILGLGVCAGLVILLLGFFTCCCGFLLMAIPYVGTVVLLPIPYFFRVLSIAFLAQFGDDFDVFESMHDEL